MLARITTAVVAAGAIGTVAINVNQQPKNPQTSTPSPETAGAPAPIAPPHQVTTPEPEISSAGFGTAVVAKTLAIGPELPFRQALLNLQFASQLQKNAGKTAFQTLQENGPRFLVRGIGDTAVLRPPYFFFMALGNEGAKRLLKTPDKELTPLERTAAGLTGGACGVPLIAFNELLTTYKVMSPNTSTLGLLKKAIETGHFRVYGIVPTFFRETKFGWLIMEGSELLRPHMPFKNDQVRNLSAGLATGLAASVITQYANVARTRMVEQAKKDPASWNRGFFSGELIEFGKALSTIIKNKGLRGLFAGNGFRSVQIMITGGIMGTMVPLLTDQLTKNSKS